MSIIYLDTSALLKLYIQEKRSEEVSALLDLADGAGTSILTFTEMASAMARAVQMKFISDSEAESTWRIFSHDWPGYTRLKIPAPLTERAADMAWEFGLRGYDAMHLASALTWQDALEVPVCLATFDQLLWGAGQKVGMDIWPENLEGGVPTRKIGKS